MAKRRTTWTILISLLLAFAMLAAACSNDSGDIGLDLHRGEVTLTGNILTDNRRALMEATNIPSLFIESDLMDRRVVSEAQLKNRVDAFFEGLATRKRQAAICP